ncbi:actin nucleation-promoting factor WAS isoform X1 [Centroberyx gerrardi]|uniref:actin nucleation-promoting factor WAS isoform X1 n=1 Tax=Centroberyx gerrardi TaxID=166262 RepID=UPI003AAB2591
MASSPESGCQVMSDLLSVREKGVLFTLLGPQCKLVASAVAQVLVANKTKCGNLGWSCWGCGVVCLIEDNSMHSYFLRLYCVKRAKLLWEQEVYAPFKYTATCIFFHTFPSDDCQAGLNFADETEAEGFRVAVESIQRNQESSPTFSPPCPPLVTSVFRSSEKTSGWSKMTYAVKEDSSTVRPEQGRSETSDSPESGVDHVDQEKCFSMHTPSKTVTPTTNSLDPAMRKLLRRAGLSEGDLEDKDTAEVIHCIIKNLGGLEVVRREMKNRGPASQTLPRSAGASISLNLKKGPLPPVPSITHSSSFQHVSKVQSPLPPWVPPPPSGPAPPVPEKIKKSASFKPVGSPATAESGLILTTLRDAFRQNQLLQRQTSATGGQMEQDTGSGAQL